MAIKLILNPGSTSTKIALFSAGESLANHTFNFQASIQEVEDFLKEHCFIQSLQEISEYGVRVVHGGKYFVEPTRIDGKNLEKLKEISDLAPLHNPPAIALMESIFEVNDQAKVTATFDTSFHKTIPDYAKSYALPRELVEQYGIQHYGFHGIACQSVVRQVEQQLGKVPKNMIVCHLGGGCSVTAVKNGQSIDNSMGFTPLEGLVMATRSGDIDPEVLLFLSKKTGKNLEELETMLNKKSGIYGMSGGLDMREAVELYKQGDEVQRLTVETFLYRVQKYVFAYFGDLQGLDCIVFSGGIGEGSDFIRQQLCERLAVVGVALDEEKNKQNPLGKISQSSSDVDVFVVHVDEEGEIEQQM